MERVRACGARKKRKVDVEARVLVQIFLFFFSGFFFSFFSSLGSILRFPLQQTPFWPNGKGTAILQARGDGHLLQMYRKRWGGSKLAHSKERRRDKNALHFETLAFALHCRCCPPPLKRDKRTNADTKQSREQAKRGL